MEVSVNGGVPRNHPFSLGIFRYKPPISGIHWWKTTIFQAPGVETAGSPRRPGRPGPRRRCGRGCGGGGRWPGRESGPRKMIQVSMEILWVWYNGNSIVIISRIYLSISLSIYIYTHTIYIYIIDDIYICIYDIILILWVIFIYILYIIDNGT